MEQAMVALARANEIRIAQADLRRGLAEGHDGSTRIYQPARTRAAAILRDPDEIAQSLRLDRLLSAVPGYRSARIARVLRKAAIDPRRLLRRLGELSERERESLARVLDA